MAHRSARPYPSHWWAIDRKLTLGDVIRLPWWLVLTCRAVALAVRHWRVTGTGAGVLWMWGATGLLWLAVGLAAAAWIGAGLAVRGTGSRRGDGGTGRAPSLHGTVKSRAVEARVKRAWAPAAAAAGLHPKSEDSPPPLRRIRTSSHPDGYTVTGTVDLAGTGADAQDVTSKASRMAAAAHARQVTVVEDPARPGRVHVTFHYGDALARTVESTALAPAPEGRVTIGRFVDGTPVTLSRSTSLLVVGETGSGKSGLAWALLRGWQDAREPVRLTVCDPKRTEFALLAQQVKRASVLDPDGPLMEVDAYASTVGEITAAVDAVHGRMLERRDRLAGASRDHTPTRRMPREVLIIDEALPLQAMLKKGADSPLAEIIYTGRALGFLVVLLGQASQLDVLGRVRDLIPQRVALATTAPTVTDAALGMGATARGAACHTIPEGTPGVGYVARGKGFDRFRAVYITDADAARIALGAGRAEGPGDTPDPSTEPTYGPDDTQPIPVIPAPVKVPASAPRQRRRELAVLGVGGLYATLAGVSAAAWLTW